jgi:HD-GYP domain-containing protein (c-di-GMP phosphodiesterase class II)
VEEERVEAEGGVRTVLLDAVRATDEALRGLGRAERSADAGARVEIHRVRTDVRHAARMVLESLLGTVEVETGREGHSRRVAATARAIGDAMGMAPNTVIDLEQAARLHDVGELLLEWEHMRAPRDLIPAERRSLRRHPTIGERLLPTVGLDREACRIVGAHHERLDGSGYPDRLVGESVPLGAQVLAVAEAFEAMTHPRPHRRAIERGEALDRLRREAAAGRFNARAVEALAEVTHEA